MKKWIIGNWKMHGDAELLHPLTMAVAEKAGAALDGVEVVLCPSAVLVPQVMHWLIGSRVKVGGQDCHTESSGAYTGDISASMLAKAGCSYVIVGHSERRRYHNESNEDVSKKAAQAIKAGITPIICIGETETERKEGRTREIISRQVKESLPTEARSGNFLLAYEPVWAIGSGKTPMADDIGQTHAYITSLAVQVSVLYGGSVTADNAKSILSIRGVAGVLVGGASLKADAFCKIIESA